MKKYIQMIVALVIVLAVIWVAQGGIAWASGLPASEQPVAFSEPISAPDASGLASPPLAIDITDSGIYNVGGICIFEANYTSTDLEDKADAEIPVDESSKVPFLGVGRLFFPGCHVVHYKDGEVVREMSAKDGKWKVCFGANLDMKTKIYYYLDDPESGAAVWIPLPTTVKNGLACADAPFTGVYMPAGKTVRNPGGSPGDRILFPGASGRGSVVPPPSDITINESGTYAVGGVCAVILDYHISGLSDNLHVEFPTKDNQIVPFPENEDLLYLPGCHLLHYRDAQIKQEMTREEGDWEICFATRPGKEMTIYFYRDDNSDINPPWVALDTTTDKGLACAPLADYSGVYAPAGK